MRRHRNIYLLGVINFLTDFRLYSPVAILYFSAVSGSYLQGMSVFAACMAASMVFEIPTGIVSDRIGRKFTLTFGAIASTSALIAYASAEGLELLLVGAVLEGLSRALYSGNNQALLYDTLRVSGREERFHDLLGKLGSLFQVALAVSAILGGLTAEGSFKLVMWLSVPFQAAVIVVSLFLWEPVSWDSGDTLHVESSANRSGSSGSSFTHFVRAFRLLIRDRRLRRIGIAEAVSYAVGEAGFQFQAAFIATVWPVWAVGAAKTMSHVGAAASFWFSGALIDRFGELTMLLAARIIGRIMHVVALVFPGKVSPVLFSSTSLLFGVGVVSSESIMQKRFSDTERATMGSVKSFAGSLLFAIFAPLLGLAADAWGPIPALLASQVIMLIPIFILARSARDPRQNVDTER